jgi:hypothetical protein
MNCVKHRNNFGTSSPRGWYLVLCELIFLQLCRPCSPRTARALSRNPTVPILMKQSENPLRPLVLGVIRPEKEEPCSPSNETRLNVSIITPSVSNFRHTDCRQSRLIGDPGLRFYFGMLPREQGKVCVLECMERPIGIEPTPEPWQGSERLNLARWNGGT